VSGLREALENLCDRYDRIAEEVSIRSGVKASYDIPGVEIRSLLAAHPAEPAPLASRERVAEVLVASAADKKKFEDWMYIQGADEDFADALLAAGVFRDEAEVKAEALTELRVVTSGMSYFVLAFGPLYHSREAADEALAEIRAGEPS